MLRVSFSEFHFPWFCWQTVLGFWCFKSFIVYLRVAAGTEIQPAREEVENIRFRADNLRLPIF